ncbi:alpha/beta hydrolase [Marinobacterium aestuarii]|uniref:Alpha/beta hydrolase n=2 Tax=Marinobacterium aestuarii TaxID=1821621 RepID=A0A1A9EZP5_9GAMM|nr:alpha/beta fold hydrolase [Marinobacterium aestuarii]ANG63312.1 alpha/beta hydrolase [Marinobacterium aestuarii]
MDGQPRKGRILFAHGAGAPMDSDFMQAAAQGLADAGYQVLRFEFPYMQARREDGRRRPPNRMPQLLEYFRARIDELNDGVPLWLAGKSMGGRVATMLLDNAPDYVRGALVFGYPFYAVKKPQQPRIEHLTELPLPVHVFQGTRDALGNREAVESYGLSAQLQLHWLEDGDHDLKPRRASGFTQEQHLACVFATVAGL